MHTLKTKDGKYALKHKDAFKEDIEIIECGTDKTFTMPGEALLFMVAEAYVKPHLKASIDATEAIQLLA